MGRKREKDRHAREKRRRRWLEKREKRMRGVRRQEEEKKTRKLKEMRKKRERNVVWRGVDGENEEERLWLVEEILKRTLRREVVIRNVRKRKGGRWVMIVELEKKEDKEEVIEKGDEIGIVWRVGVDEDLTMEERKRR